MPEIQDQELDGIYAFAIQLGKDAGRMLMNAAQSRMQGAESNSSSSQVSYVEKENSVDLVTKTDTGDSSPRPPPLFFLYVQGIQDGPANSGFKRWRNSSGRPSLTSIPTTREFLDLAATAPQLTARQFRRRRNILSWYFPRLPRHRHPDLDRRPPRWHCELHPPLPHVLRLHSLLS